MGHEQNKQWGRTAGQNAISSCSWKEEIRAGRGREKDETGLKACLPNQCVFKHADNSKAQKDTTRHIDNMNIFDCIKKHSGDHSELWDISASYEGREGPACAFHPCGLRTSWGRCRPTGQVWRVSTDTWMLYDFWYSVVLKQTPVTMRATMPLDYASLECHVNIVQFLLKALKCSVEKLATWQPENSPKIVCGAFPRGLRRLLGKQCVCDLFLTEHVICNPYALEHDEEKRLKGHKKYPNGDFWPSAQLAIPDQVTKNPAFASKAGFLPAWMRKGPPYHFDSVLYTNSSLWRWMTPKMVPRSACESQINLVPDEDVEDAEISSSTAEEMSFIDKVVRNHCFLEEGSNFLGLERMERHNLSLSSLGKLSSNVHFPKSDKNSFHLFAHCNQNYVYTTSHVFGTQWRHT